MEGVSFDIQPGDTTLISGPSGAGKSTLFRAIAGIWPFGRGEIRLPRDGRVLFLPQKPYLPIGTLREVVSYPTPPAGVADAALREALAGRGAAGAGRRASTNPPTGRSRSRPASSSASPSRARSCRSPTWLFLDEATSAVDEETEARLYTLLRERLPAHDRGQRGPSQHAPRVPCAAARGDAQRNGSGDRRGGRLHRVIRRRKRKWRRGRDSNPRSLAGFRFSRPAPSTGLGHPSASD